MKTYHASIGTGLYHYEIKAKNLREAKRIANWMCIYPGEKVNWVN